MFKSIILGGLAALVIAGNASAAAPQQMPAERAELPQQSSVPGFPRFRKCQKFKRCYGGQCYVIRRCA